MTLVWWDPAAEGPDELQDAAEGETGAGLYRYVDGGKRYLPDEWDGARPVFFDEASAPVFLDERPARDIPPDYPRRQSRTG